MSSSKNKIKACQITLLLTNSIKHLGAVFRAKDLRRDYKKMLENAIKDLSPDTKDNNNIIKLLDSWKGIRSEEKLKEKILGQGKAEALLENIKAKEEDVNLTNDEQKN